MKYLKKLHKHIYNIKREMSAFKSLSENTEKMFVNTVVLPGETKPKLNIILMLSVNPPSKPKRLNLCRCLNDTVTTFIDRVNIKINQVYSKKIEKPKKSDIELLSNGLKICGDTKCGDVFENYNSDIILKIKDTMLKVVINAPMIHDLKLNTPVYQGLVLYPFGFEKDVNHNVSMEDCTYLWYRMEPDNEVEVGNTFYYTPTENDVNYHLKLVCSPCNKNKQPGPVVEISSSAVLKNDVPIYPFENRLKEKPNNSIRVVSYNILAGEYTRTKEAKFEMYPYCTPEVLASGYRNPLILKEILAYKADILCLQEVESTFFDHQLQPFLKYATSMKGNFLKKNYRRKEGLSCFYSPEKFTLLNKYNIKLNDLNTLMQYCGPVINDVLNDNSPWKEALEKQTVFQVLILELISDQKQLFLVCNTHLISDPEGDYVRLFQALIELIIIYKIKKDLIEEYPKCNISVIFCGDFNSTPDSGVYDLATSLMLPEKYRDVKLLNDMKKRLNFKLKSAYSTDVEYSNYTNTFFGLLDYIYFSNDHLEVIQVLSMPPHDDVIKYVGLPSLLFPSDHLALVADFKLK